MVEDMEILGGMYRADRVNGNGNIIEREGLVLIDTGLPRSSARIVSYIRNPLEGIRDEPIIIATTRIDFDILPPMHGDLVRPDAGARLAEFSLTVS